MTKKKSLPTPKEIGQRFQVARKAIGATQTGLATAAGVFQSSIARFEGGERFIEGEGGIRFLAVASLAGISLDFVFTGEGAPKRETLEGFRELAGSLRVLSAAENVALYEAKRTLEGSLQPTAKPKKRRKKTGT